MQMNWSIVLNILLLVVVIGAIIRTLKLKRSKESARYHDSRAVKSTPTFEDDIIAVRKINQESKVMPPTIQVDTFASENVETNPSTWELSGPTVMMFLLAKNDGQFMGYELLQTLLAAGLRFGEEKLFHRHLDSHGQGAIMCSVAAATENGTFDLHQMDTFSVRGLCIFMQGSSSPGIDAERFGIMVKTAKQLSQSLDAHWLNQDKHPITSESLRVYEKKLGIGLLV